MDTAGLCRHLDSFSDWVDEAQRQRRLYPHAPPGPEAQARVREMLGFCQGREAPLNVQAERRWTREGVAGEQVSWSVGYGPRTVAWVLRPAGASGPLPGVVALHDHGGFKYCGKEKIAEGPEQAPEFMQRWHAAYYGGRPFANALARKGFVVLVHDTFLWGSRRFPLGVMPEWVRQAFEATGGATQGKDHDVGAPTEVAKYNYVAAEHEHVVEKYCNLLGTTLAGVVSHEDRIAANYLCSRPDVRADQVGCVGLSGGGNRAALLQATYEPLRAAVVVGLMSTYAALLDQHVMGHTWMFFPSGWARYGDWPDLAGCRAPSPLLVQYDCEDELFPMEGMRTADERLAEIYASVGCPECYRGEFYPGPHKFDIEMQQSAFAWLGKWLVRR